MDAASSKVEGMSMELALGLKSQNGSLNLPLLEWGCHVKDVFVKLDGGATWLYQGYTVLLDSLILFLRSNYLYLCLLLGSISSPEGFSLCSGPSGDWI